MYDIDMGSYRIFISSLGVYIFEMWLVVNTIIYISPLLPDTKLTGMNTAEKHSMVL